ncbi:mechanosensitive ion channel family protein [Desulforhabdus amnigena]|jgi:small-conductance mechanosensitive channel|uniref:Mechanosensitive ion channel family protein n=1 Tax=Desulforhabdus amnigena TaxID=40218 RepID=A0A9W6FS76_9BACT|nr:mechanosensitive ion channel family protein [Desulforhabdus amnigena]NLJ26851.1 mechanosensitive ion channel family protein [Deltaproteobacteria bacterium]GLI33768.1 hypothetical protein DAMNIGENAA_12010 [Desulforhabdus amnigena]
MAFMPWRKIGCIVFLGSLFFTSATIGWAQGFGKVKSKAPPKEEKIPANLTPEQVDGYLAGISDEQARRLLAAELKEKATEKSSKESTEQVVGKEPALVLGFFAAQSDLAALSDQLGRIVAGAHMAAETDVWEKLVGGKGLDAFLTAMALLVFIILMGWAAERVLLRKTEKLRSQLLAGIPRFGWEKAGVFLSRLALDILGLAVYVLVTFLTYFIIYGQKQTAYIVSSAVVLTYYFRIVEITARVIASPKAPELRLLFISDSDARFLYNWIIWISASVIPGSALALALQKSGANRDLFLFVYSTAGPIVSILLAVMIWQVRHRVAMAICPLGTPDSISAQLLRRSCANYWHYPAVFFALAVGGYWWVRVLTYADATIRKLILSLFLVPLCIGMDQWLQQILTWLSGKPREVIDLSTPDESAGAGSGKSLGMSSDRRDKKSGRDMSIYFPVIRKAFRAVLLIFLFFAALELWGIEFDFGWIFARNVLGVVIALVLGLIAWEVVKARIDQRIKEEIPFESDEGEEGGAGGSGGSRSGTLLLLLRKFIMAFLFIVIGFSILASLGVNIAPLLAGAGVVGLAIGFGSQTLVKDIIAGVFFLIDDAFRVGDYVEAGTAKGTVEHISLRSIRLRHPRGQIFVVPFGDLKMVQNFTRDYIIEKIDIRVRFDTDPDAIRKIIKKINKQMKEEEFGSVLLSDIKSVGVRAMDDSAMIMRVKFKCIPGEQFILRREVFHRIQKAFKEKGIEFAQRNVTVYLPPQPASGPESSGGQGTSLAAAGAAAAAAIAQAEAEALAQSTEKKKPE